MVFDEISNIVSEIEKAKDNILKAESNMHYKRDDVYNEFLNEIYMLFFPRAFSASLCTTLYMARPNTDSDAPNR